MKFFRPNEIREIRTERVPEEWMHKVEIQLFDLQQMYGTLAKHANNISFQKQEMEQMIRQFKQLHEDASLLVENIEEYVGRRVEAVLHKALVELFRFRGERG